MFNYLWLILLFNALFAWMLIDLLIRLIFRFLYSQEHAIKALLSARIKEELDMQNLVKDLMTRADLKVNLQLFLDERIDLIMQKVALQVPMGDYLLSGVLGKKIKDKVKQEVEFVIPDVEEHLLEHLIANNVVENLVEEKIRDLDFKQIISLLQKKAQKKINLCKCVFTLLGIFVGVLEVLFFLNVFYA